MQFDGQPAVNIHVLQGERELSQYNKTLGRFDLIGIPPAPRGVPQIEVTFDIDANGIVHVAAKDLGTGKEQSIRITASSGLNEDEIKRIVKEAEAHAEEDKNKILLVGERNHLDGFIYSVEKSLKDSGTKVDATLKSEIESELKRAKDILDNGDIATLKAAYESLSRVSDKMAAGLYSHTSPQSDDGTPSSENTVGGDKKSETADRTGSSNKDGTIDADFHEV